MVCTPRFPRAGKVPGTIDQPVWSIPLSQSDSSPPHFINSPLPPTSSGESGVSWVTPSTAATIHTSPHGTQPTSPTSHPSSSTTFAFAVFGLGHWSLLCPFLLQFQHKPWNCPLPLPFVCPTPSLYHFRSFPWLSICSRCGIHHSRGCLSHEQNGQSLCNGSRQSPGIPNLPLPLAIPPPRPSPPRPEPLLRPSGLGR